MRLLKLLSLILFVMTYPAAIFEAEGTKLAVKKFTEKQAEKQEPTLAEAMIFTLFLMPLVLAEIVHEEGRNGFQNGSSRSLP